MYDFLNPYKGPSDSSNMKFPKFFPFWEPFFLLKDILLFISSKHTKTATKQFRSFTYICLTNKSINLLGVV
jgi:hypothetical protein